MALFKAGERSCEKAGARALRCQPPHGISYATQGKASHFTQRFAKVLTLSFHAAAALKPVFNGDKNAPENASEHVATIKHISEYVT